jgi:hypothetical protein
MARLKIGPFVSGRAPGAGVRLTVWLVCGVTLCGAADAASWYVNNKTGSDANDGRSAETACASIARALEGCVLANGARERA